jgi:prepilin-type processing-associated H-X9-DG protein
MNKKNIVFIARSLDGFIADKSGGLDWLHSIPNPDNNDMGFVDLMNEVDAVVMGRTTYETVIGFGGDWPYTKHVFVLSNMIKDLHEDLKDRVSLLQGELNAVLKKIHNNGYNTLYVDGGTTIQNFLKEDLIDELRITTIPIILGGGFPLFGELNEPMEFDHVESKVFLDQIVQDIYRRKK